MLLLLIVIGNWIFPNNFSFRSLCSHVLCEDMFLLKIEFNEEYI